MILGSHMSEESKAKMSTSHMGKKHPMRGHIVTPEARVNISLASRGHITSFEQRMKISVALKGRKLLPETRAKISAALASPEVRAKISEALWKGGKQVYGRKSKAKRRLFGFTPLNAWFIGCEGHHVDNERIIYMPKTLHRSVFHRQSDGRGMAAMNAIAYNFLFKQEVEVAMKKALP